MPMPSGTLDKGGATAINVAGDWTNNGGTFTPTGDTVNFNGGGPQTLGGTAASQTFNNFTVNKGGGTLTGGGSTTALTISGNLTLTAGTFAAGTATTINLAGNLTPAGTTVQLHFLTTELNGNSEATAGPPASLRLYRYVVNNPGTGWQQQDIGGANTTLSANHFVKVVGIKGFSPWTIANSSPTAAPASIGGTITDTN